MVETPSYHTMNVHHFATVLSIVHSYFTNFEEYGILVLILSDVSDCFLNIGKQSRDLQYFKGVKLDAVFGLMIVVWLSTRTFSLPICFTQSSIKFVTYSTPLIFEGQQNVIEMFDAVRPGLHIVIGSVYAISVLNMYWTKLILGLLVDKLFKKSSSYDCNYETFSKGKNQPEKIATQGREKSDLEDGESSEKQFAKTL